MNPKAPQLLAGDTNVGMDLAPADEWVLNAMTTIRQRLSGCSLLMPPTVAEKRAWLARQADEPDDREAAHVLLRRHRSWGLEMIHAVPLGNAYVERIAGSAGQ
ncbi:MAG TPA: hypothetical protein VI136_10455 [Verrucomicrobiae bacterium]